MRRVLLTGGAGFIGSHFTRYLLSEALRGQVAKIIVLDALTYAGSLENLSEVKADSRFVFQRGDIRDRELLARLLREYRIDLMYNLAAETHVDRSIDSAWPFVESNILGTSAVLEESLAWWRGQQSFRLIQVSTDEVFGSLGRDEPPFTEESPIEPNSPYAASKAAGDCMCRAFHRTHGLPVIVVHGANNYGPRQFPEKLIPLSIHKAMNGQAIPLYGDGRQRREWLYMEDFAEGMWRCQERGVAGERYLLGAGQERENREVVQNLLDLLREHGVRPPSPAVELVADRPGHDVRYASRIEKADQTLGWKPRTEFHEGLRETVSWYLSHRDWLEARLRAAAYRAERLGGVMPH